MNTKNGINRSSIKNKKKKEKLKEFGMQVIIFFRQYQVYRLFQFIFYMKK